MACTNSANNRIVSIDVECMATGFTHEDRAPCSVALVDSQCQIIFSSLIKSKDEIVSDLYPLTGLRIKDLEQAPSFDEVLEKIYALLDPTTIIVGQKPQAHEAMVLLNIDLNAQNGHLATEDARASILLYLQYKDNARDLIDARRRLLNTRSRTTPAKANNYKYEGVCLSAYSANLCTCGRPIRGDD
ncbi:unnamed protein product [Rotaria sordida]|uniref:Exonuclease domain-containing protein n=1 Tax=Rotaria sordida TaxID=392033 RepID=A0A814HP58_9BILA|nr:unnamed protein product [Rotaria sordida]